MTQRHDARPQAGSTRCPFLMEVTARCCRLAPFRKLVPEPAVAEQDQCCLDAWRSCAWVLDHDARRADSGRAMKPVAGRSEPCPFLDEMLACSCEAASFKLIPKTLLAVSRCLGDSHRYCEFFLERACPRPPAVTGCRAAPASCLPLRAAEISVPPHIALAPNHMWLDEGSDESCHVGIDALMVRVLGVVDEVTFLSACGPGSPRLALTVAGTTLPLIFPQPIDITGVNSALRRDPDSLTSDPYGRGWLYEGRTLRRSVRTRPGTIGLIRGSGIEIWMASETERLSQLVHAIWSRRSGHLGPVAADGGEVSEGLAQHLERTELLEVFSLFFTGGSG